MGHMARCLTLPSFFFSAPFLPFQKEEEKGLIVFFAFILSIIKLSEKSGLFKPHLRSTVTCDMRSEPFT